MAAKIRVLGIALVLVGAFGALVPFVGPLFGYTMGSTGAWVITESRVTLHLIPGLVAILGGSIMVGGSSRARLGAVLALLGGIWFTVGPEIRPAWAGSDGGGMMMMGGNVWSTIASSLGYHDGTGVVIIVLAAYGLGAISAHSSSGVTSSRSDVGRSGEREPART